MSLFTFEFLVFLGIVFVTYYAVPKRFRHIVLLVFSYIFYASYSLRYLAILLAISFITYLVGLFLGSLSKASGKRKVLLGTGLIATVGVMLFFRFWTFGEWIAPVGLSFFALQAAGYVIDVYLDRIKAEKNILEYLLFVSFFPTLLSGPIERAGHLLPQIKEGYDFSYEKVKNGALRMLWGFFLKLLIANRLSMIVDPVMNEAASKTGATICIAVLLYTFQLYADFAGYSNIAIGMGSLFGFELVENFKQPFFSKSVGDFWNRWHISLSSYLRDYVYIPLGGSRCSKLRTCFNLMITFLVSGIWHGTGLQFLIWGALHGLLQIAGRYNLVKKHFRLITFILVNSLWLFFRAPSFDAAGIMLKQIFTNMDLVRTVSTGEFLMGYSYLRFVLLLLEIFLWMLVDVLHERGILIMDILNRKSIIIRWGLYIGLILAILTGIIHDFGIDAGTFIYAKF